MYYDSPFPHVYEKNVLPDEVYKTILQKLPADDEYDQTQYHPSRKMLSLLKPGYQEKWEHLIRHYFAPITKGLLNTFRKNDHDRYAIEVWLIRDVSGYEIPPHTDLSMRVMSALFYLPHDYSLKPYGTCLCVPREEGLTSDGAKWFDAPDDPKFDIVKKADFVPNSMLAFPRSDTSFHMVPPIGDVVRNQLLVMVREKEIKNQSINVPTAIFKPRFGVR